MTPPSPNPPASDQFVQSLARGLGVITAFDAEHDELTLSEVAARTNLSRAAARRFLLTLVELGFMRTDGSKFALTPQVLRLGSAYLSGLALPDVAQPHLEELSAEVGESTSLAVLDRDDIVYVARVATRRIMSVSITVGTRFPAFATSMGRVLLAGLDADTLANYLDHADLSPLTPRARTDRAGLLALIHGVHERGWALVDQELERGLRSIAVPVHRHGVVVAAVNVSTSVHDDVEANTFADAVLPRLLHTAKAISSDLAAQRAHG